MIVDTNDLDKAFEAYKNSQIMRKDMIRHLCDHVIALEAAVKQLTTDVVGAGTGQKMMSEDMENIIERLDTLDKEIENKVAAAANNLLSLWQTMNNGSIPRTYPPNSAVATEAKRRGRPPKSVEAGAGG